MLRGVTANLMFTDLILRVFNEGICIMSGAFQPAVMARIFPRYSFTFSCTQAGQGSGEILSGGRMGAKIISALMYDLIPSWHRRPVHSLIWLFLKARGELLPVAFRFGLVLIASFKKKYLCK